MKVSAVVLAAGHSTRFGTGREKLLAEWNGRTLIEHVLAAALNALLTGVITEVVVVAAEGATRIKSIAGAEGFRVVSPHTSDGGISSSLRTGIAALAAGAEAAVILLGDQPMVKAAAIAAVVDAAGNSPQALVRAHYHGSADMLSHPVFIGRYHFGLVHKTTADEGFNAVAAQHRLKWTEVWLEGNNPDIDFPADLDRLK